VFPSEVGTPLEQGRVHKHWSKTVEKAGALGVCRLFSLPPDNEEAARMAGVPSKLPVS
jgi:hypothetical protein